MFTDGKIADVDGSLARLQDPAVVELDFVVRHLAGIVHAGVPRERRLVLAVHDRNGKTGHLFRRRRILDREADFRLLARIALGIVGNDIGGLPADSEITQNGGSGRGFDRFVAAGHDIFCDRSGVVLAGEREHDGVTVDRRFDFHRVRCGHVFDGEGLNFAPLADIPVLVDGADFIGVFADRKVADVQCGLARLQDFAVVELDFVVRHLAGVVHAIVPRERRLVLAVNDRNGKAGHLLRRRGVFSGSHWGGGCCAEVLPGTVRVDVNRPSRSILIVVVFSIVGGNPKTVGNPETERCPYIFSIHFIAFSNTGVNDLADDFGSILPGTVFDGGLIASIMGDKGKIELIGLSNLSVRQHRGNGSCHRIIGDRSNFRKRLMRGKRIRNI